MTLHVVAGPPCAGKTTFAREQGGNVIDLDDIEVELGGERYAADSPVRGAALRVRAERVAAAFESGADTWLIHTAPTAEQLAEYERRGAVVQVVNPGLEVCLERAKERPPHTADVIRDWFQNPANAGFFSFHGSSVAVRDGFAVTPERGLNGKGVSGMSEQTGVTGTTGEPNSQGAEGGKDFTAITSQADFDAAIQNRLARERAKFADYDDLKAAAGKFAEFEESQKSEAQKQSERLAAIERENAELKLASARAEIGAARSIDPSVMAVLAGSTREEIEAAADALVAFKGAAAPQKLIIPSEGKTPNAAPKDESEFVKELFAGGSN